MSSNNVQTTSNKHTKWQLCFYCHYLLNYWVVVLPRWKTFVKEGLSPRFFFLMWKTFIHRNLQPNQASWKTHVMLLKENTLHWWTWQMHLMHWLLLYITSFNHSKWLFVRMFHLHSKTRMQASANNTSPCCQRWAFSQALTSVGMSLKDQFLWSFKGLYNPDQEGGRFCGKLFSVSRCALHGWQMVGLNRLCAPKNCETGCFPFLLPCIAINMSIGLLNLNGRVEKLSKKPKHHQQLQNLRSYNNNEISRSGLMSLNIHRCCLLWKSTIFQDHLGNPPQLW